MNDIRPPQRPVSHPEPRRQPVPINSSVNDRTSEITELPVIARPDEPTPKRRSWRKRIMISLLALLTLCVVGIIGVFIWYLQALQPVDGSSNQSQRITIEGGLGPAAIADLLEEEEVIRSSTAFEWYVRLEGVQNSLQAGTFTLGAHMPVSEVVAHLLNGKADTFSITFFPGATLRDTTNKPEAQKTDVATMLMRAGYESDEIEVALHKTYNHPVFVTKPTSADIEGYVYGETYEFSSSSSVEDILVRTFDELYSVIQEYDLVAAFKERGLSLYEGLTLASIVQRELPEGDDQKTIAGVFYNRLEQGMPLGADPTYQYASDKAGVPRDPAIDSPYNTRRNVGLPPGPIAAAGELALLATAQPNETDYLYFLSGDDDTMRYGRDQAEHEANIQRYCQSKCQIL